MSLNNRLVLITDDGKELARQSAESLKRYGFEAELVPNDGKILIQQIIQKEPRVVVLDVFLRTKDSIEVMETILLDPTIHFKPIFLVTSNYDGSEVQRDVMSAGATFFFLKPFDVDVLSRRIERYISLKPVTKINPVKITESSVEKPDLEVMVTDIIRNLGIPPNIKGYQYLRTAIILSIENPDLLESITKELYPSVAKVYGTTASRVERAIRHSIEVAWDRGDMTSLGETLGYNVQFRGKPTNSELVAMVADRLRIQLKSSVTPAYGF